MTIIIAIILFLTFAFLSGIHFYWGFGGRWASQAVFPTKDDTSNPQMPGALPTFIVAVGLLAVGLFVLSKGFDFNLPVPLWLDNYGLWMIAGIFMLRAVGEFNYVGFFKKIKHTKFGQNDTNYYSPLCLAISLLTIILILF